METEFKSLKRSDLILLISIALINLTICLVTQAFFSYGIFRDEFYYLACANRLDLGYVDHPPLSIYFLALWKTLFGDSLIVIRVVPSIVSSVTTFFVGLLTIRLGGKKFAVIISTLTLMLTPIFLGMYTIYSMNSFDFLFWILSAYIFLRIIRERKPVLWLHLGVVLGLGLLNKTSVFWLGAGIFAGTLFTPARKDFRTIYPYLGGVIALIIFSPYIIWNLTHDLAHLEFMRNAAGRKYGDLTPLTFLKDQIFILNPFSVLIWLPGLIFYFFNKNYKQFRALGFIWLTTFLILFVNWHSKAEYIAAAYPILFAGGAVMIEKWGNSPGKLWIKYSFLIFVLLTDLISFPFGRPLLKPETFIEYQSMLGLQPPKNENHKLEGLPQFYADMFGWEELAKDVSEVYQNLPEDERRNTFVYCSNYGKAGAIEYFAQKYPLPRVISPHNNYWYWWPEIKNSPTIIIIGGNINDHLQSFEEVYQAGFHKAGYAIPYENNLKIFIGRKLKIPLDDLRDGEKLFI